MKFVFAAFALLFSASSWALIKTESNMSPGASQFQVQIAAEWISSSLKFDSGIAASGSEYKFPFSFYYGINENNSIGIEDGYQSLTNKVSAPGIASYNSKATGMNDLTVDYLGNFDVGMQTLFVKAFGQIPTEKFKLNDVDNSRSAGTGQPGVGLEAGLIFPAGGVDIGFSGQYTKLFQGDMEYTTPAYGGKTFNGNVKDGDSYNVTLFLEGENSLHPFLGLGYTRSYTTNYTIDNTGLYGQNDGLESLAVIASLDFEVVQGFELVPGVIYGTLLNKEDYQVSNYDTYGLLLNARFTF